MRLAVVALGLAAASAWSQAPAFATQASRGPDHELQETAKAIDDVAWRLALGYIAEIDKVRFASTPPARISNASTPGAGNPLVIAAYTFVPKTLDRSQKQPLVVYAHGGVHANFSSAQSARIVRELVRQGYTVIAPDYRGSTGYGRDFYEQIDYGGREVDDVDAARAWMLAEYSVLDAKRIGMIGWSHGGMITLLNIFEHPNDYAVAYAGVPVSDLVARLGYQTESYRQLFSAPYHIGKTVREDIAEYRRRSPVNDVDKLARPFSCIRTPTTRTSMYLRWSTSSRRLRPRASSSSTRSIRMRPAGTSSTGSTRGWLGIPAARSGVFSPDT